jgi:photosystem II stability/assembly factor-like uncharacterized protein
MSDFNSLKHNIFHKFLVVLFTTICVLSTAASCSLNPFSGNQVAYTTLGILKNSPETQGFQKINSVKLINGKSDNEGLSGLSVIKVKQQSADTIFIQTLEKGVFKTTNGGQDWSRIYVFPVEYTDDKEGVKILEAQLKRNEDLVVNDFWVSSQDNNVFYIAAKEGAQGKIYKTTDGGRTMKEVYTEINNEGSSVDYVVIDPQNEDHVYALLNANTLIHTLDAGSTWQKLNNYSSEGDKITQIGLLADNRSMFILYQKAGLSSSVDGIKWNKLVINKFTPPEPRNPNETLKETATNVISNLQDKIAPEISNPFSTYTKFIPIGNPSTARKPAIVLADKEIWLTSDFGKAQFVQLNSLPVQDAKLNVQDVQVDSSAALPKIYVAIGNKILVSENNGKSWSNLPINIDGIGPISNIILNPQDPQTIYLSLYNPSARR